jgi:hypothetical protein
MAVSCLFKGESPDLRWITKHESLPGPRPRDQTPLHIHSGGSILRLTGRPGHACQQDIFPQTPVPAKFCCNHMISYHIPWCFLAASYHRNRRRI